MKKILALLFLFLSSFCLTSCIPTDEEIFQAGYDSVTLPTRVTEDFELPSYCHWAMCKIYYYYVSHNTDIIRIEKPESYRREIARITRSKQDVDVSIECFIESICCNGARIKTFTVTVVGLENDMPTSSSQEHDFYL